MKNINWHAIAVRAVKSFVQAFLATWALTNYNLEKGALVGAATAGVSAIMNVLIQPQEAK
jgi:hypothetical protein